MTRGDEDPGTGAPVVITVVNSALAAVPGAYVLSGSTAVTALVAGVAAVAVITCLVRRP